jgi:radical SAM protein with 4Fe4S-binding SPASM domain
MDYALKTNTIPAFFMLFLTHVLRYHKKGYTPKDCGAGNTVLAFHDDRFFSCYRYFDKEDIFSSDDSTIIQDFCKTCEVNQYCEKGCLIQQLENQKPIEHLCELYKHIYKMIVFNINTLNSDIIADKLNYV